MVDMLRSHERTLHERPSFHMSVGFFKAGNCRGKILKSIDPELNKERVVNVCVVGGSGFIGTNLCQRLADQDIPFTIVDLKPSARFPDKSRIADIRAKATLENTIDGDVVVNLAAVHTDNVSDPRAYHDTNVLGTRNLAEICAQKGIPKIVFTSTVAVYGFAPPNTGEEGAIKPFNEYGRTKWQAEQELNLWYSDDLSGRSLIIVRPTVVFGEGNRGNVFNLFNQIASGRFIMIGTGRNTKSIAYVGNVAAFLERCILTESQHGIFNYVDTPDYDMNALVKTIRRELKGKYGVGLRLPRWAGMVAGHAFDLVSRITGRKFSISVVRVQKFTAFSSFSSAKHELDGFEPSFTLEEGLKRTLQSEFLSTDPTHEIFYTE